MAPVYRVILVQYKPDLDSEAKEQIARGYLALAEQCKRDGQAYFTVVGGANISQEGLSGTTEVRRIGSFEAKREDLVVTGRVASKTTAASFRRDFSLEAGPRLLYPSRSSTGQVQGADHALF